MTRGLLRNTRVYTFGFVILIINVLLLAAPSLAYEEDTHFLMTYVICKSAGFTHEEALTIAAVDQGMDDSVSVNAHDGGKPQIEEEWLWHALDKNGDMRALGIVERRDKLFNEAVSEMDPQNKLIRLGIFFHYQQDTWAHRHHEKDDHLSRDNYTTFNTPAGHGPWGSKPDRPPLDPVAAFMCLEDGIIFASEFLSKSMGREPSPYFSGYTAAGGEIDLNWEDGRNGEYFRQLDVSSEVPDSNRLYLKSLIVAQINAYSRSRDYNPFYFGKKTPDFLNFEKARRALQGVCDRFSASVGRISIPKKNEKLARGFTAMTTAQLLSLGTTAKD